MRIKMKKNIKIGIIGLGYWGPNLLRNFLLNKNCEVNYICDSNTKTLNKYAKDNPNIKTVTDYKSFLTQDTFLKRIGVWIRDNF